MRRISHLGLTATALVLFVLAQSIISLSLSLQERSQGYRHVRTVMIDLLNLETGQRGYLLTGREDYLQPYYWYIDTVGRDIRNMRLSLPKYKAQIDRLEELTTLKIEALSRKITLRKEAGLEAAVDAINEDSAKGYMDEIRWITNNILKAEEQALDLQQAKILSHLRLLKVCLVVIIFVAVSRLTLGFLRARRDRLLSEKYAEIAPQEAL
jgi:CHASE3 domain sensor protein